ncbi:MAG TPA: ATP synthase F1 subunit delta [Bacteroidales bacterium]|nr:ATP synthase F1 subunit delta [Bacteroidales bacterium]HQJ21579.1 ATP synthase F1 subunit delta [Bacteroidales bacterium]
MNESKIPVRYAKALFESAVNNNLLDRVYDDIMLIAEICKIDEVNELLKSPIIPPSQKRKVIHEIFDEKISTLTMSLIDLMIKNGREEYIPAIARIFRTDTLRYKGITETNLVTAMPVSQKTKNEIIAFIESKFNTKVIMKESVDPGIIGGFVLKVNDYLIDASVKTKLRKIKQGLSGSIKV